MAAEIVPKFIYPQNKTNKISSISLFRTSIDLQSSANSLCDAIQNAANKKLRALIPLRCLSTASQLVLRRKPFEHHPLCNLLESLKRFQEIYLMSQSLRLSDFFVLIVFEVFIFLKWRLYIILLNFKLLVKLLN